MVAAIAKSLGTPLLPWQRHVADVATERLEDGRYAYRTVVISVPRQTGKTTLITALAVTRGLLGRDVFYTAQTAKDARERWGDLVKVVEKHPVLKEPRTKVALRGGSEHILFRSSGAKFQVFAPKATSLHGYHPPTVVLDEAFAHSPRDGELLMGAIKPAQQTVLDKQVWLVSTRGTAESTFFHDWIDRGIEQTPGVACFYWGATEDQSPYDADDIAAYHPGIGFRLGDVVLRPQDVLAEREGMSAAEYVRAYGNKLTPTAANLIKGEQVHALRATLEPPADTRDVVLAYDVDAHRTTSAIVAAWTDPATGKPAVRLVRAEPGTRWLAAAVADLDRSWRPAAVVAAGNGPVLDLTEDVQRAGVKVTVLGEKDQAAMTGGFLDGITGKAFLLAGDVDDFLTAFTGLATRAAAVDGVALSRRHSIGPASRGVAAAAALHVLRRLSENRAPVVRFSA